MSTYLENVILLLGNKYSYFNTYRIAIPVRAGTLICHTHAEAVDASEFIVWTQMELIRLTLVASWPSRVFLNKYKYNYIMSTYNINNYYNYIKYTYHH